MSPLEAERWVGWLGWLTDNPELFYLLLGRAINLEIAGEQYWIPSALPTWLEIDRAAELELITRIVHGISRMLAELATNKCSSMTGHTSTPESASISDEVAELTVSSQNSNLEL